MRTSSPNVVLPAMMKTPKHAQFADDPTEAGLAAATAAATAAAATAAAAAAAITSPAAAVPAVTSSRKGSSKGLEKEENPPKNIHEAAERGLVGFITRIVERNIQFDVNCKDKYDRTALHWAAEMNEVACAEALMDYGCSPVLTECNGRTAIHLAARNGHVEMLQTLMESMSPEEKELHVNKADIHGLTPVFLALQKGADTRLAFELLMESGGHYNTTSYSLCRKTASSLNTPAT